MAEEEAIASAIEEGTTPLPSDQKRKFDDLEPEQAAPQQPTTAPPQCHDEPDNSNHSVANLNADEAVFAVSDESDAKRLRLDDMPDGETVIENGHEAAEKDVQEPVTDNDQREDTIDVARENAITPEEAEEKVKNEDSVKENREAGDCPEPPSVEKPESEMTDKYAVDEVKQPSDGILLKEDVTHAEQDPTSDKETITRKMEVPNNKVGVLIGKAGDTIRLLQHNSGALIQITRDLDADLSATTRPVELTGSLESINKAEKLIRDVIAEADAGGSPALVARGFSTAQAAEAVEKIEIQVPNEKVGLIIGRGGETIKGLQTRSGARIQLIPQRLPDGDQSMERTVRVSGDKKQIELAKELMDEVMSQTVRASSLSTGYNQQQGNRARGHGVNSQWGSRGPHVQPAGYDYQHRGPYQSHQNSQYPPQQYGNYPQHNLAPRSGFGGGWDHRPPQSGGYDYYGRQSHLSDGPASAPRTSAIPSQGPGLSPTPTMGPPHTQPNYNYGQPQGPEYGQPAPFSAAPTQQSYGYENQTTQIPSYGGHASSQPAYPQAPAAQGGYGQQQQYARPPPSYGMPMQQGPPPQSYGPPRASQLGDNQGPIASTQSYGQQQYPYASGGQMPQSSYPAYGFQPAGDGYNQPQPVSGPAFPQQGGQLPVQGYAQGAPAAYPSSQQAYTEQSAQNNAGYGYQATGPIPAYGAPPGSQPVYSLQPQAQSGYDQSGGYASVPR